jgi:hypothetical protein
VLIPLEKHLLHHATRRVVGRSEAPPKIDVDVATFPESEFVLSTHDGGFLIFFRKSYELETFFGVLEGCQGLSIWSDGRDCEMLWNEEGGGSKKGEQTS